MRYIALAILLAVSPVLAGPPAASALTGFTYSAKSDLFGYYMPAQTAPAGRFKLIHVGIGLAEDFASWKAGDRWDGHWAPLMLVFAPAGAQPKPGAEGGVSWEGSFRVMPTAYQVSDTAIAFVGKHPKLGLVTFTGKIDAAALKKERSGAATGKAVVMTGELKPGGPTIKFTWFAGD